MIDGRLILISGVLLVAAIVAALAARRIRVPGLVLFLALGTAVGSGGLGFLSFSDLVVARSIGTIGLALILFEGGLAAGFREVRPVLRVSLLLATAGTAATAAVMGLFAAGVLHTTLLKGMLFGSIVAATDSAAIFSVLRGSSLRRKLARTLEAESGFNDPLGVLLVTGCINLLTVHGYGATDILLLFLRQLGIGSAIGVLCAGVAVWALRRMPFATTGLYPVASVAVVALAFGAADILGGSGFVAVYLAGLVLGNAPIPARRTIADFHDGLAWVSQIALFFTLGLLVSVAQLTSVAPSGLVLAAALLFVARPLAVLACTVPAGYSLAEAALLGWAGLRGAVPIVLAIFPVIAGVAGAQSYLALVFFVVLSSALLQGTTFESLARWLGVTSRERSLARPLIEIGEIQRLGAEVVEYLVAEDDAIVGRPITELGLPQQAIVSVIVRAEQALVPRGATPIEVGDRLHVLVTEQLRDEVERLCERWRSGPIAAPVPRRPRPRAHTPILTVRRWQPRDGDPNRPRHIAGVEVTRILRVRQDRPGALVQLADGRFAVTADNVLAVGGPRELFRYCTGRIRRHEQDPQRRLWWQEVAGALTQPAHG